MNHYIHVYTFPHWLILFYGHLVMAYFFSPLSSKCTTRHKEMGLIQTAQTKRSEHLVSAWFCIHAFFFFPQVSVFSRLSLQNTEHCFFICTCAQRQRLRGSRKEKIYKDNTLGSLVVKSRASAGIFSWSFRQQNFCCDREQRSNRLVRILLLWVSVHLSNWKKKKQSRTKKKLQV